MIRVTKHLRRLAMVAFFLAAVGVGTSKSVATELFGGYGAMFPSYIPNYYTYSPYGRSGYGPYWHGGYDPYGYDSYGYDYYGYNRYDYGYDNYFDDRWYDYGYGW